MSKHTNKRVTMPTQGKSGRKDMHASAHSDNSLHSEMPKFAAGNVRWWVGLISAVIVFIFASLSLSLYPHTQSMMEKLDFFVATGDFFAVKLSEYPGVNSLLQSWILQFFHTSAVGTAVEAAMLSAVVILSSLMPLVWFKSANSRLKSCSGPLILLSAIPALGLLLFFTHKVGLYIEALWFYVALCLVGLTVRRRSSVLYFVVVAAVGLLSFFLLSFPVTILLMVSLLLLVLVRDKSVCAVSQGKTVVTYCKLATPLFLVAVIALLVKWSSESLGFIPLEKRWWYVPGADGKILPVLLLLLAPLVLMFIPRVKKAWRQLVVEVLCCVVVGWVCYRSIASDDESHTTETVYSYLDYAEDGDWLTLLDEIRSEADYTNMFYIQCAMLAEAKLGTLPDNLFSYPINNPEQFCPRFDNKPYAADFCRIFYRELGIYDEAFHQAFEYGMKVTPESGFCFSSLRHMTEYAVKKGDCKLAEKYLSLLNGSSCHSDFIAQQRDLLKGSSPAKDSLRSDDFIRASLFNSEMAHQLDYNSKNRMVSDYLLCGLLLTKNLEIFKTILIDLADNYKDAMLPRAYAEAAAMINHLRPGIFDGVVKYSPDYDRQFEQFMALHNSGQDDSAFKGTFWYYYVYAQIPSLTDWQNSSHSTTS